MIYVRFCKVRSRKYFMPSKTTRVRDVICQQYISRQCREFSNECDIVCHRWCIALMLKDNLVSFEQYYVALDTTVHTWVKSSSKGVKNIFFSGWNVAYLSLQSSRVLQCYCFDSFVMQSCWTYRRDMKKVSIVFWNFYVICRSSAQTKNNTVRHYKGPR